MKPANITRDYGLLEKFLAKKRTKLANNLIDEKSREGILLDIGCGTTPFFLQNIKFRHKIGLDPNLNHISEEKNLDLIKFDLSKYQHLPFKDNTFNIVTMLAVFEHIEQEKLASILGEIYRVLKKGGRLILTTPCPWTDTLLLLMSKIKLVSPTEIEDHKGTYNHNSLLNYLKKGGFMEERIKLRYFEFMMNNWAYAEKNRETKKYKQLSIIIPVYNEEKTIKNILEQIIQQKIPIQKEIIIVNDGSTDKSEEKIKEIISTKNSDIRYFHKENGGKGSAVRFGLKKATGDIFLIQDADLEYDPKDYNKLLEPIMQNRANIVYGSRYQSPKGNLMINNSLTYKIHLFGNKCLSFLTSILYFQRLSDMETCYKMFTKEVYDKINLVSNDFQIEPEITAKIIKNGYKIQEIPINYYSRDFHEGKKITWIDGLKAAFCLIKWRFKK